ncbi:hypothetical protein [Pelomonas sp. KK5]|uniref:hypothetical protein n=1 Tax=Pelomonas sp. KK5 TaxID=1855730 RepID=UPI00097C1560|nr:hypothetical protein [Pelomonas sp. KK5]
MIHPLFRTLATRPELLAEHLGAYAQLVSVEAGETTAQWRRHALWAAVMTLGLFLFATLAGTALLLLAVVPLDAMPMPWLLAAVPAMPLLLAVLGWLQMRQHPLSCSFELLREQVALDTALLKEASEA